MTKDQLHQRLFIIYQQYPTFRLTAELVTLWWDCFKQVDPERFWTALKMAIAGADNDYPPTVRAVHQALERLSREQSRDLAPHTPQEALMFILALAKRHGLASRLEANYEAKQYPLIFQTIKLTGYETVCRIVGQGSYNPRRSAPTTFEENRVKALIVKTYTALYERLENRRRTESLLPQLSVDPKMPVNLTERQLLNELFAPGVHPVDRDRVTNRVPRKPSYPSTKV